jgi:hypothetical protein
MQATRRNDKPACDGTQNGGIWVWVRVTVDFAHPFPHCNHSCYAMTSPLSGRPGFDPGPVNVGFVADKVAPVQVSLPVLSLSPVSITEPTLHTYLQTDTTFIRRTSGRRVEPSDKTELLRISGQHWTEHCFNFAVGIRKVEWRNARDIRRATDIRVGSSLPTRVPQDRSESAAQRYTTAIEIPLQSRAHNCLFPCRCNQTLVPEPSVTWQVNFT